MYTPPSRRPARRACAGLAAAAVTLAGLTCLPASAAEVDAFPATIPFEPTDLAVVGDDVVAVGTELGDGGADPSNGYVAMAAGGESLDLGPATTASTAAAAPDGSTVYVLGTREVTTDSGDGPTIETHDTLWSVDVSSWEATVEKQFAQGSWTAGVEVDAAGAPYVFGLDDASHGRVWEGPTLEPTLDLGLDAAPMLAGDAPAGARYLAGSIQGELGESTPMMWRVDGAGGVETIDLGEEGHPATEVTALAVDPTSGVAYASVADSTVDYSYGLNVVDGDTVGYVPTRDQAWSLALSPDGTSLYTPAGYGIAAFDTENLASYDAEDNQPPVSYTDGYLSFVATAADGRVYAADQGARQVYAFEAPAAPANLSAAPDSMSTTGISVTWEQGKHAFELENDGAAWEDLPEYVVTVQAEGGEPNVLEPTRDQVQWADGLVAGQAYTVTVTAVDGAFRSPVTTTTVTTHARHLDAPSAVSIEGSMTVGSRLSLKPTGAWETGTDLSYEWYGSSENAGGLVGHGPTLALTTDHLGMNIVGVVTGTKSDAAGVTLDARGTTQVAAAAPAAVVPGTPRITGAATVGKRLTVRGNWPAGTTLTYVWTANGDVISGATGSSLKLTRKLSGKRIAVVVTAAKAGYATVTTESASKKVQTVKQSKKAKAKAKQKAKQQKAKSKAKKARQKAKQKAKAKAKKKARQKAKKRAKKRARQNRN